MKNIPPEEALLFKTKRIAIGIECEMNRQLKQYHLTAVQAFLIVHLYRSHSEGTFVTTLHREFGVSKATISGLIKKLKEKGYLKIVASQKDERHRRIVTTEKLASEAITLQKMIRHLEEQIFGVLSIEEQNTLQKLQEKILLQIVKIEEDKQYENNIKSTGAV